MKFQIDTLMTELEKIQKAPPPDPAPSSKGNGKEREAKKKEFKETYPDMYEMAVALAEDIADQRVEELKKSMPPPSTPNPAMTSANSKMSYYDALSREIPGWESLNNDPEFLSFINQPEPFGRTKAEMLMDAFSRNDVRGSAHYFRAFMEKRNPGTTPPPAVPPTDPAPPRPETPASIPRGGSAPVSTNPRGEVYTRADLAKLYDEKRRGVWKNKDPEFKARETKITKFLTRAPA